MRGVLRHPLLHFLLLGGLLFWGQRVWGRDALDSHTITLSRATREHVVRELHAQLGRAPTKAERRAGIEKWKADEAVYREAVRLGILERDGAARARLIARARALYQTLEIVVPPSEGELEAYLQRNRARYELPERFDVEHAFAARERGDAAARAEEFRRSAERGAALATLGDAFEAGAALSEQAFDDLARVFGFGLSTALVRAPDGEILVLEGTRGMHAVRITRRRAAELPPRDLLRARLLRDYSRSKQGELGERALRKLAGRYVFTEEE